MEEFSGKVLRITNYRVEGKIDAQGIVVGINNGFSFQPGQYLMLSEDGFRLRADPSKVKWTPYSISSSPLEKKDLEFVYTVKYTGGFTQYLAEHLKKGSTIHFKGPFGKFILEDNTKEKIFIATGAGIAPILSMIRTLATQKSPVPCSLFYGFRTGEHFLYKKQLESIKLPHFTLIPTISRDDPSWKGERGHVQDILRKKIFSPKKQQAYICGSPTMVKEVTELLLGKGFEKDSIKVEQW